MKYIPLVKKCVICGRMFECYHSNRPRSGARSKGFRPFRSVACSKSCSRKRNEQAQDKHQKAYKLKLRKKNASK